MLETQSARLLVTPEKGDVSALLEVPAGARAVLVLGHGAGSHLHHALLESISSALHRQAVATLRYNYPYSERGRGMDSESVRLATVRAAVAAALRYCPGLPAFAGGHSMSGRMTSLAASREPLPGILGIVFLAFPLHPGPPEAKRAEHLGSVGLPLLFVSGTRDKMADVALLQSVTAKLARATLHLVEGADHGLHVPKTRRPPEVVMDEIAAVAASWMLARSAESER
jgi:hypothetical protein